jgi:hypothetical protein
MNSNGINDTGDTKRSPKSPPSPATTIISSKTEEESHEQMMLSLARHSLEWLSLTQLQQSLRENSHDHGHGHDGPQHGIVPFPKELLFIISTYCGNHSIIIIVIINIGNLIFPQRL